MSARSARASSSTAIDGDRRLFAIRCPRRAAWIPKRSRTCGSARPRLPHAGARRHRSGLRRSHANAIDACNARRRRFAGPAVGTRCFSRWIGSAACPWTTPSKPAFADFVERYRMAGHDLEVDAPRFVSLEIEMHVCVKPDYFRSDVEAALWRFSATASCRTAGAACFIRTISLSARRFISVRYMPRRKRWLAWRRWRSHVFQREGTDDPKPLAGRDFCDGPAGNRAAATTIRISPSAACFG